MSRHDDAMKLCMLHAELLRGWKMPAVDGSDKFQRGTVLVVGGSARTPGAVRLAGEAALRMGAGRLQAATAAPVAVALAIAVPEAMVLPLETTAAGGLRWTRETGLNDAVAHADAVLIGPGMADEESCRLLVESVMESIGPETIVVLDALALCGLSRLADHLLPRGRLVLTPNRQELRNLASTDGSRDSDDALLAARVARRFDAVVTCFGRVTSTDECWTSDDNRPGLGTSGSGDVLAGLVAGAAARCRNPVQAACWGTYAHSTAAARLAQHLGEVSFIARDLVAEVPAVLFPFNGRSE
jgi:hydroxyethylthiazole kinase-like uncharacterized protein yjeF